MEHIRSSEAKGIPTHYSMPFCNINSVSSVSKFQQEEEVPR